MLDWEQFRPITEALHDNKTENGGHPNFDSVLMIKILALRQWYGLSDHAIERGITDRLSFMKFFGLSRDDSRFNYDMAIQRTSDQERETRIHLARASKTA